MDAATSKKFVAAATGMERLHTSDPTGRVRPPRECGDLFRSSRIASPRSRRKDPG